MCIICNVPLDKIELADEFLEAFASAGQQMKRACDAMLAVSKNACRPDDRKRYDAIHKEMVRKTREWNALEQKREHSRSEA